MRVSVVVPVYNKAATVERCLRSIAAQTLGEFEAILVDDGSSDGSGEICAGFKDGRFRLVRQANAGPGAARNRGIAEAGAPLVAFLDADDEWLPEYLEEAVRAIEGGPFAASTCAWYDEPGARSSVEMWRRRGLTGGAQRVGEETGAGKLQSMLAFLSPCSTVARTEVVRRHGGFYAKNGCRYGEDAYLWLRVLLNETVTFRLEAEARFYHDASQLSGNYRKMRPIEPFLEEPEPLREACPARLRGLLEEFLALRALKTACVLGYWGHWREGVALRRRFEAPERWRTKWYWASMAAATPAGAVLGKLHRMAGR